MARGRFIDDIAVLDRLVPAPAAIDLLAAAYAHHNPETPMKPHQDAALRSLLNRLTEGVLEAWSTRSRFIRTPPVRDDDPPYGPNTQYSYFNEQGPPKLIPSIFWQCLAAAKPAFKDCDLVTGDFSFEDVGFADGNCSGSAFAVHFDLRGLPAEAVPTDHFQLVDEIKALMATGEAVPAQKSTTAEAKEEKKPNLSQAELLRWWNELGEERESISKDVLVARCKAAFPGHSIARQRVRDLAGPRKHGPKPKSKITPE